MFNNDVLKKLNEMDTILNDNLRYSVQLHGKIDNITCKLDDILMILDKTGLYIKNPSMQYSSKFFDFNLLDESLTDLRVNISEISAHLRKTTPQKGKKCKK